MEKTYAELIKLGMELQGYSQAEVCRRLKKEGVKIDNSYLSKILAGRNVSINDNLNIGLSKVLGINQDRLRVTAFKEKFSPELIELIKKIG